VTAFASHRLVDLFAEWTVRDGRRVGVNFACPHCKQVEGAPTLAVLFANPDDGGAAWPDDPQCLGNNSGKRWTRTGDTLETLTLSPSVDCSACGHWHNVVANGEAP
jgi:hypothetical protein